MKSAEIHRLMEEARVNRQAAGQTGSDSLTLRRAILNFFDPVYSVLNELHDAQVYLIGLGPSPVRVPTGRLLREATEALDAVPHVQLALDRNTTMVVTLATRKPVEKLADLEGAKWRCRLILRNGPDDTRLFGSVESLTTWLVATIMEYEYVSEGVQLAQAIREPKPEEQEAPVRPAVSEPPRREQRVITLDDLNEETQ